MSTNFGKNPQYKIPRKSVRWQSPRYKRSDRPTDGWLMVASHQHTRHLCCLRQTVGSWSLLTSTRGTCAAYGRRLAHGRFSPAHAVPVLLTADGWLMVASHQHTRYLCCLRHILVNCLRIAELTDNLYWIQTVCCTLTLILLMWRIW